MYYGHVQDLLCGRKNLRIKPIAVVCRYFCHTLRNPQEENLPSEWYEKAFPKLTKLANLLKDVDLIDGRLVSINDNSRVADEYLEHKMRTFKSLATAFIGCSSVQQAIKKAMVACLVNDKSTPPLCFSKPSERRPIIVNSLTKVCNFLNISAQQRKEVRLAICPQVTQHQIWISALEETLNAVKSEIDFTNHQYQNKVNNMAQQIVMACLKFLKTAISYDHDSTSWMRVSPTKDVENSPAPHKWEDVLEMFNDLINCLQNENELVLHVTKLGVMKEGLSQIQDILIDKNIGYREIRYQESLVQRNLSKTLGHSSQCLFTLLLYYLYGTVRDIEVELCGRVYSNDGGKKFSLCMGKILTSDKEKMVRSGMKQLDRALGLFKFVWESAGMKEALELQGHLWCFGAESRRLEYRQNVFFVHGITF